MYLCLPDVFVFVFARCICICQMYLYLPDVFVLVFVKAASVAEASLFGFWPQQRGFRVNQEAVRIIWSKFCDKRQPWGNFVFSKGWPQKSRLLQNRCFLHAIQKNPRIQSWIVLVYFIFPLVAIPSHVTCVSLTHCLQNGCSIVVMLMIKNSLVIRIIYGLYVRF